jgi:DNA-directed RNA polymerase specialized sigma24 family protein
MAWFGHQTLDPSEIEARFSQEDSMQYMEDLCTEMTDESQASLDRVRHILDDLPPREADFVNLYFFLGLKQTDIANIFLVSQPTVCYRLQRATARIQFLLKLPPLTIEEIQDTLKGFLADPLDINIMTSMYETTCQSEVAKLLGVSQGLVRHRFLRALDRMNSNPALNEFAEIFNTISKNLNILREVQRSTERPRKVQYIIA